MKKKIWDLVCGLLFLLQLAAETVLAVVVLKMNMLPDKYIVLLIGILAVLLLFTGFFLFIGRKESLGKTLKRIFACLLSILIIVGCGVVAKMASDAHKTVQTVTKPAPIKNGRDIYIFVRADDPAQTLEDVADYSFGVIENYDVDHIQQAIENIEQTIGKAPDVKQYVSAMEIADSLFEGELDAAVMNGVSVTLMMEQEGYADFTEKARILTSISPVTVEVTEKPTEPAELESVEPDQDITNTPFIIYISGSDTRSAILDTSRSDVNILMVVNPITKQVLLINTPRDYYIGNPAGYGQLDKLTHCGIYGIDCSVGALEDLYDIDVDYYGQINFTGVETLVDALGGVDVYSDRAFTAIDTPISVGMNHMDGKTALAFSRERYRVPGGDNDRGKHQMQVIKAIIEKITNGSTILSNYSSILKSLEGMFVTDVSADEISLLVKMQLNDMRKWDVRIVAATGYGGNAVTYSMPGLSAYVMYPNQSSVEHNSKLISLVLSGEILTEEDLER